MVRVQLDCTVKADTQTSDKEESTDCDWLKTSFILRALGVVTGLQGMGTAGVDPGRFRVYKRIRVAEDNRRINRERERHRQRAAIKS